MTELEKAAEAREIDICQYSTNNCLNTNACHRCQWGVPSLDLRCSNNASFKLGAQWQAKQSPWISVEERLPDEGQNVIVLVMYEGTMPQIVEDTFSPCVCMNDDSKWVYGSSMVIAWMPIPSFDYIIGANKDVLQRIKEKED